MRKIVRYPNISFTPALLLATKGWLAMNMTGMGELSASIHWEQKGIVAFDDEAPIGVLTWTHQPSLACVFVEQAYVEPAWRCRGIFRFMWADLLVQATEMNVPSIKLGTHPDNRVARDIYQNMGGRVTGVFYQFDLAGTKE